MRQATLSYFLSEVILGLGCGQAQHQGSAPVTYVVSENCINCKYMDCVEVCPVDCFYVGENMLVIHLSLIHISEPTRPY